MEEKQNHQMSQEKRPEQGSAEQKNETAPATRPLIKPRDKSDPRATVNIQGEWYAPEEMEDVLRQKAEMPPASRKTVNIMGTWCAPEEVEGVRRQHAEMQAAYSKERREKWLQTPHGKLCVELYEKFQEYKKFLDEHLYARRQPGGAPLEYDEHNLFAQALAIVEQCRKDRAEKDRKNLARAQMAARCQHTHLDGKRCRAPRVRGRKLCRMHQRMEDAAAAAARFDLGSMEDPDSIQLSIMKLQRGLIDGSLANKDVGQLAYLIQLAAWNVTRTSFAQRDQPEGARPR